MESRSGIEHPQPLSTQWWMPLCNIGCRWFSMMDLCGTVLAVAERPVLFCADDGLPASRSHEWLQMATAHLTELLECVGLQTNAAKTKAMTCMPSCISGRVASPVHKHRREGGSFDH